MQRIESRRSKVRPARHRLARSLEALEGRQMMAVDSYLVPVAPGVVFTPLLTVGLGVGLGDAPEADAATDLFDNGATPQDGIYRMVGLPDGMGAFDNGDGTFTVLMNHEAGSTLGHIRDHGAKGSFVSKWVIDKATLSVISGDDLIKTLYLWDSGTNSFVVGAGALAAINRLCSADLPEPTAFYNAESGLGSSARIFMNGEETSNGRAFAHVVTGPEAGTSWELPWTGKYAWENHVASPFAQDKTIVVGLDDSRRDFTTEGATEPSEVYVWVGNKKSSGLEIEKAGLVDGILHGVRVGLPGSYDANESTVASGERFELVALSDQTNNPTFHALQAESVANSITQFRRVEDGHFDPQHPNDFYFVTTDNFGGASRLWLLRFDDIENPEAGGTISIVIDGWLATSPIEMFDNMTVDAFGNALLQEDVGGQTRLGKIWQHDIASGELIEVAQHNGDFFLDIDPITAGVQSAKDLNPFVAGNQGTIDEESSGIIDLSSILGAGYYLVNVQAHLSLGGELVEGGQLLVMNTNASTATLANGTLSIGGTINADAVNVTRHGNSIQVEVNGQNLGTYAKKDVARIVVRTYHDNDTVSIAKNVQQGSLLLGGTGDDLLASGGGNSVLIGGDGVDALIGGSDSDLLIGGTTAYDSNDAALLGILAAWSGNGSYASRVSGLRGLLHSGTVLDDGDTDVLVGRGSKDWFFSHSDILVDRKPSEQVN